MDKIKTIADFKRSMDIGSVWDTKHRYIGNATTDPSGKSPYKDMGVRECVLNNSVDFGFKDPKSGNTSHSRWPKKVEFTVTDNGHTVIITKENFCELTYTKIA